VTKTNKNAKVYDTIAFVALCARCVSRVAGALEMLGSRISLARFGLL
jgi:hypothetical protein